MKKIDFVDFLTKKDINNILGLMGYKLIDKDYREEISHSAEKRKHNKYYIRHTEENGEHSILCFVRPLTEEEHEKLKIKLPLMLNTVVALSALIGINSSFYNPNAIQFIKLENYFVYEALSIRSQEDQLENMRNWTKAYDEYMKEKFGKFYTQQKNKYLQEWAKNHRENEEETEEETKEN